MSCWTVFNVSPQVIANHYDNNVDSNLTYQSNLEFIAYLHHVLILSIITFQLTKWHISQDAEMFCIQMAVPMNFNFSI